MFLALCYLNVKCHHLNYYFICLFCPPAVSVKAWLVNISPIKLQIWDNFWYNVILCAWRAALLRISTLQRKNLTPEVPLIIPRFPLIIFGSRRQDQVAEL